MSNLSPQINKILTNIVPNGEILDSCIALLGPTKEKSFIVLMGIPFDDNSSFYKEVYLIVVTDQCECKMDLKGGYNPKFSVHNFTPNQGNDIYVTIDSGGSGGFQFFYLISLINCKLITRMSDDKFNEKFNVYTGNYLDYCKVVIYNDQNQVFLIDLVCKGSDYLSQIYDEDGKLLHPQFASVGFANYSYPVYDQQRDCFFLYVLQRVTGLYNADSLGYIYTALEFEKDSYKVREIFLSTYSYDSNDCVITIR